MRKVFVAWSGGLDSTYALYDILQRGDLEVIAHHIHFTVINYRFSGLDERDIHAVAADRAAAELDAVARIRLWLVEQGFQFALSRSTVDVKDGCHRGQEAHFMLPHILNAALNQDAGAGDLIVWGANRADYPNPGPTLERWNTIARMIFSAHRPPPKITFCQNGAMTRADEIAAMPPALTDLVMSCRRPRLLKGRWTPCGRADPFKSRFAPPEGQPCTCARLVDLLPRYRNGWDAA